MNKNVKEILKALVVAENPADISKIERMIYIEYEKGKMTKEIHELLYDLIAKIDGCYRRNVKHFSRVDYNKNHGQA